MTHSSHSRTPDDDGVRLSAIIHAVEGVEIKLAGPLRLGASALYYAEKFKWPVFMCKPRGKTPLTAHGFQDATLDAGQIRADWQRRPDANIATPTGADGCGFDVIDVDGSAGMASLRKLVAAGEMPPVRAVAFTPGDPVKDRAPGRHLYVDATGDGNAAGIYPGIDYRGAGGYVLIPPSVALHAVGYAWINRPVMPA